MNIIWNPSPNFSEGRKKYAGQKESILAIVNHKTAGKFPGCLSWLCNPAAEASAHYLITRAGEIYQLVRDDNTAWHAGIVNRPNWALYSSIGFNPNRWTIGIEHEDYDGDGELGLTEVQYRASLWLHQQLVARYGIPIDTEHIVGHYRVDSVNRPNCPGPDFPWARLFNDLQGGIGMKNLNAPIESWEIPAIQNAVAAGLLAQMHDPREVLTYSEISAIMLNLLNVLRGGK